jgi:hypothetical protein
MILEKLYSIQLSKEKEESERGKFVEKKAAAPDRQEETDSERIKNDSHKNICCHIKDQNVQKAEIMIINGCPETLGS